MPPKKKLPRKRRMQPTSVSAYAKDDLSPKQLLFVSELLASEKMSATEAARKAGYSQPATAGYKLLANPIIARLVGYRIHERLERNDLTQDEVINMLTTVLRFDPLELFDVDEFNNLSVKDLRTVPKEMRMCLTKIKPKKRIHRDREGNITEEHSIDLEFMSKDAALQLAMRHFGLIVDNKTMRVGLEPDTAGLLGTLLTDLEQRGSNIVDARVIEQKLISSNKSNIVDV